MIDLDPLFTGGSSSSTSSPPSCLASGVTFVKNTKVLPQLHHRSSPALLVLLSAAESSSASALALGSSFDERLEEDSAKNSHRPGKQQRPTSSSSVVSKMKDQIHQLRKATAHLPPLASDNSSIGLPTSTQSCWTAADIIPETPNAAGIILQVIPLTTSEIEPSLDLTQDLHLLYQSSVFEELPHEQLPERSSNNDEEDHSHHPQQQQQWYVEYQAIESARRLMIFHPDLILQGPGLAKILRLLDQSAENLRSAVAKNALWGYHEAFALLWRWVEECPVNTRTRSLEKEQPRTSLLEEEQKPRNVQTSPSLSSSLVELIRPSLAIVLKRAVCEKRFLQTVATKALDSLVVHPDLILEFATYARHGNPKVVAKASILVSQCLRQVSHLTLMFDIKQIEVLVEAVLDFRQSKDPRGRAAAKASMDQLRKLGCVHQGLWKNGVVVGHHPTAVRKEVGFSDDSVVGPVVSPVGKGKRESLKEMIERTRRERQQPRESVREVIQVSGNDLNPILVQVNNPSEENPEIRIEG